MEIKSSKYSKELEVALKAAEKAGEVMDRYAEKKGFEDWDKEDGSVVTEADIESQEKIVETIREEFPEDGFLGEEENLEPDGEDRVWIIDPIDGTFNFDSGFGFYCVSIALEIDGEIVLGVVHLPESSMDRTYLGVENEGAYVFERGKKEAENLEVSDHSEIEESLFFMTDFDIYEEELDWELELLEKLARKDATHRQVGSAAIEHCFLAEGRVDFLVNPILKPWDYSAAKLIIEEAGGKVDVMESPFPDSELVVASNGKIHEKITEIVEGIEAK
ncbi:MAG: inositol monophosphatase [Candidatus Nanohaloarchaea archaeon]